MAWTFKIAFAPAHVRQIDHDLPVETAGPQQRRVQHVRPVGRGDDDDAFLRVEAVHLDQQRIERLLAFVVAAAQAVAAAAADRVNFVNENQARRVPARLLEHVAHAAGADADEHLHKVRAADAEERGVRLAGDGLGQQRFARAGRPDHQHALGNAPAEPLEFFRVLQKFDQFGNFLDGFLDAGHVLERGLVPFLGQHPGLALAEAQRALAGHLDLADEEKPEQQADSQKNGTMVQSTLINIAFGCAQRRSCPSATIRPACSGVR